MSEFLVMLTEESGIQVAPLWTNAFVYMVMGRLVWNFSERAKVLGVHAWRFGLYFVMADIL